MSVTSTAGDPSLPERYVRLSLAFDRLEEGFVDAYTGPPRWRAEVADEPAPHAADLVRQADALLAEVGSSGLPDDRQAWLRGQLVALRTSARVMAGEPVGFVQQVTDYFQVVPTLGDQDAYADAHRALERLLPGDGPLAERVEAHRTRTAVPPELVPAAVEAVSSVLRDVVRRSIGLPEGETVDYQVVTDKPWAGFNYYRGDLRSEVAVNADLPIALAALPELVAHESYPGHHTEHCRKETTLADRPEARVFVVNTPECLVAEGLADLGLRGLGMQAFDWTDLWADLGLRHDEELSQALAAAAAPLGAVRQDAALLLHDRGAPVEEVEAYLARWALMGPDRASASVRFLTDPLWRAYISTYVEGERLLGRWLDEGEAAGEPVGLRFGRLLDEAITPAAVAAELAR